MKQKHLMTLLKAFTIIFISMLVMVSIQDSTAQTAPGKYWIQFIDKANSPFTLGNPSAFLSPACISRREKFSLGYDFLDIPVNENYIQQVLNSGSCELHNKSRWFNAITIVTQDTLLIDIIENLPCVSQIRSVTLYNGSGVVKNEVELNSRRSQEIETCGANDVYGKGFRQIEMLNGHLLHAIGYTGAGVQVAVLDAGFTMADKLPVFEKLRGEGRIVMVHDFVFHQDEEIYNYSSHGALVLSTMAADLPDSLVGTAPDASYYLFRTEDPFSENVVEEDNWVAAAEFCDYLGIDVINSSIGYSLFDQSEMNHTYLDMDGNTTRCSIAADIAAAKGILVVNSAGNSGDDEWHYITAPSDGDSVLCVGAVDSEKQHASFSGYGPSSDGNVKPNVVAMGFKTVFADTDSTISSGNGTSFSSPVLAGMAACLVQAFPDKSNMEIFHAIESSASLYNSPNDSLGFGVPDFWKAFQILSGEAKLHGELEVTAFPNPCKDQMRILFNNVLDCNVDYEIYDAAGRRLYAGRGISAWDEKGVLNLDVEVKRLKQGLYFLHLSRAGMHSVLKFEKINQ